MAFYACSSSAHIEDFFSSPVYGISKIDALVCYSTVNMRSSVDTSVDESYFRHLLEKLVTLKVVRFLP